MAFFDKIGESVNKGIGSVSSMFEVSGVSSRLKNCEEMLEERYTELGKLFYENSKTSPSATYDELFAKIKEAHEAIELLKKEIQDAKGTVICPGCGAEVDKNVAFCSKCGTKIS